jgi:poly(3-hydroxybutyrate) depolymerase
MFADERGNSDKPIQVWTYRPKPFTADSPIVFVMHGKLRNGESYREPWVPLADKHGCLVVVPEFAEKYYPGLHVYNYGNLRTSDGQEIEEAKWTFSAVEHLFDHIRSETGSRRESYCIFGHSAGAQFVHRMVLFKPGARIAKAVAANAGSYTMPSQDVKFPFGLAGSRLAEANLDKGFRVPLVVLLGDQDTDPHDELLPREPEALAQGEHRFTRGQTFFRAAKAAAERSQSEWQWTLSTVPGVGHDNALMAPAAARALFGR